MKLFSKFGIRAKILISIAVFLSLFFFIEAFIFYNVFIEGFKQVEEQNMVVGMQRTEGLIDNEINNYLTKLSDWANWNDTYNFIIDKNQAYIDSNLQDTSLGNLRLNFMVFIATNGAIVKEKGISFETNKDIPIPKDLHNLLLKPNIITTHKTLDSKSEGIVRLANGFILFVSRPILTSDATGPIRGTLIFARFIDKEFLQKISELEHSKIDIRDYYSDSLPQNFANAKKLIETKGVKYVEPDGNIDLYYINEENNNQIDGFTIIHDINKKPAFIIQNELKRPYYALGNKLILFALGVFAGVSLLALFFGFLMLNQLIISKITKLNKDVNLVKDPNNPKNKLDVLGNDEFATLASNINKMLDDITKSDETLKKSDEELRQGRANLDQKVSELERMNKFMVGRELKMIELKEEIQKLKGEKS